jgi:hypothetical protein
MVKKLTILTCVCGFSIAIVSCLAASSLGYNDDVTQQGGRQPLPAAQFSNNEDAIEACEEVMKGRTWLIKRYSLRLEAATKDNPACNLVFYRKASTAMKLISAMSNGAVAVLSAAGINNYLKQFNIPVLTLALVTTTATVLDHYWFHDVWTYYQGNNNSTFIDFIADLVIDTKNLQNAKDKSKIKTVLPEVLQQLVQQMNYQQLG